MMVAIHNLKLFFISAENPWLMADDGGNSN